jgi:hypothetical protein
MQLRRHANAALQRHGAINPTAKKSGKIQRQDMLV